jgi:HAD superfamily hydrolase (TIGR01484 family)
MKYKLLLCDVDGTVIPNKEDGMPSQKVIEAIKKASQHIAIGIATARSYWQIAHILDVLPLSGPCIITGGAQIIDPKTRKTFIEREISAEDIITVASIGKSLGISFRVADRDGERPYDKGTLPQHPLDLYTNAIPLEQADEFIRLISHISTISTHKALAWESSHRVHVTIANPEASKNDGVVEVARMLGISTEEIIGVGEGYNDFPFLMACGLKVAMGNAVDDVKAIADYIVPSVENDGVVDLIEKFILH